MLDIFYRKTQKFWIFSRVIFILLFFNSFFKVFYETGMSQIILNGVGAVYTLLLIIILILGKSQEVIVKRMRFYSGILSTILAFILIVFLLRLGSMFTHDFMLRWVKFAYIIPVWMIFFGIWEIQNSK